MRFCNNKFVNKSICIAICTHGRRELLLRALNSLNDLYVEDHYNISILIVENELKPILKDELEALKLPFPLHYANEQKPGLVHARNRVFDEADKLGVEWLLLIDDDLEVDPDLLVRHEQAASEIDDGYVFVGSNIYRYLKGYSNFLEKVEPNNRKLGEFPIVLTTANLMLNKKIFSTKEEGYRFDLRFNFSGSEDADLIFRLKDDGHKVSYVPEAKTYEDTDRDRGQYFVIFRRLIRQQTNMLTIQHKRKSRTEFFQYITRIFIKFITFALIGFVRGSVLIFIKPKHGMVFLGKAGLNIAQALGVIGYFVNFKPSEYDHTKANSK